MEHRPTSGSGTSSDRARALLAKARELGPFLSAQAPANEAAGRLNEQTLRALRDADLFSLMIPACLGGAEAGTVQTLEVFEALSQADGSAGWVHMATQVCTAMAASYLDDAGVERLFAQGTPLVAGQGAPNGRAVAEKGGWRVTGQWSYGSATLHADYFHSGALLFDGDTPRLEADGRTPLYRTFVIPREHVQVLGNWDVMGLRATGSVDYAVKDAFIPAELTHPHDSTDPKRGGGAYSVGIMGMTSLGHTGFALGVARRALDELAAFIGSKRTRRGPLPAIADTENFQEGFGSAEAKYRAARAFVYEAWRDVDATILAGGKMSTRQITLTRLALNHATTAASEVCAYAYRAGGGYALRSSVLQRCFRDMYAGTQHFLVSPTILRECGRELAGFAQGQRWNLFGLK